MKSLKKYFKVILCFMAFAVASFLFAFAPTISSYAALQKAESNYNMAIKAVKMPRSTSVDSEGNQSLRVPLLKTGNSWQDTAKYTIRVIDPSFTSHDYKVGAEEGQETSEADANYFSKITDNGDEYLSISALNNGKYDILYIMEEGSTLLYSDTYSVTVENVSYTLDFAIQTEGEDKGLKTLLPETVAKSTEESARLLLPTASVKNAETGAYIETPSVTVKVFNDYGTELDASSSDVFKVVDGKAYLYPTTEGKFTVEYTYAFGNNPPKKSFTVEVKDGFVAPKSSDITINIPTMPSVELGKKDITLPDVVVNNKDKDNVEHNVTKIVLSKGSISKTLTNNTFKFNMTKEFFGLDSYTAEMLGDWYVEYTIVDAYGNEKQIKVTIDGVKDNTKPEVFMAYDYDLDSNGVPVDASKIDTTVATEFKSQLGYNELYFPAIYAKDAVTSYKDFIFVRYIQSSRTNTIYYIDNVMNKDGERYEITNADTDLSTQINASGDENIGKQNKGVKFKFNVSDDEQAGMAGEYTLGYYVLAKDITKQDGYLYVSNTTMYTFNVLSTPIRSTTSTVEHNVEITNIKDNYSVASDGKFTVNINANETKRGDSTTNVDKRLKTAVFYYYNTTASATTLLADVQSAFNAAKTARGDVYYGSEHLIDSEAFVNAMKAQYNGFAYAEQKNKNNYDVKLENYDASYGKNAYVVAISIDDDGNIALANKKLVIKDMTDAGAPEYAVVNAHSFTTTDMTDLVVKQGTVVELPDVSFTDDDKTLSMNVSYYVNSPVNDVTGMDYKSPMAKNYKNNISGKSYIYGGKIKADQVGTYHVVYTATDDAGNTTFVYFTFDVTLASDPILKVSATGDDIKSSGASTITGETGMQVNFDASLWSNDLSQNLTDEATTEIDFTIEDGGKAWRSGDDATSFIFEEQGDYAITFTAKYTASGVVYTAESQTFTVTVTRPELKWNETLNESDYSYAPKNSVVTLPDLSASQGKTKAKVELKVTFKGDAQDVTKKIVNGSTVWQFKTNATLTGDYKVEYTATTAYSTITKSLTIKVGDNVPPTISIDHVDELSKDLVYDGKTNIEYTVNLVKTSTSTRERKLEIVITNGDTKKTYNTNLVLTDKNEAGEVKKINWDTLSVELMNGDTTMSATTSETYSKTYTISATGEYKLVIKATDSNSNTATKEVKFAVKTETKVEKNNDTVVGVVLIVLSLVVLAGVILFFALTGKGKGGSNKTKSNKQDKSTKSNEEKVEAVEESAIAEQSTEAETEAKSGDVE